MIKLMINISLVKINYIDPHQYNKKKRNTEVGKA